MTVNSNPKAEAEKEYLAFEGAEAIYREGRLLAHVVVRNIRVDEDGISADMVLVRCLGPFTGAEQFEAPAKWRVGAPWGYFGEGLNSWSFSCVGWYVYFDKELISALECFCTELPKEEDFKQQQQKVSRFIHDFKRTKRK